VPRPRNKAVGSLPPLLVRLMHAAERDDRPHVAQALAAYGDYALIAIPTVGVLPRDEPKFYSAVDRVARKHLGFTEARRAFTQSIKSMEPLERRDRIDSAATALQAVSDEAHFYAGIAFGVTVAQLADHR
jgi:hypothetical protein